MEETSLLDPQGGLGSQTEANLKAAFASESQANCRVLYFANKADIEGQSDVAALSRSWSIEAGFSTCN
jgi:rubrerythrin